MFLLLFLCVFSRGLPIITELLFYCISHFEMVTDRLPNLRLQRCHTRSSVFPQSLHFDQSCQKSILFPKKCVYIILICCNVIPVLVTVVGNIFFQSLMCDIPKAILKFVRCVVRPRLKAKTFIVFPNGHTHRWGEKHDIIERGKTRDLFKLVWWQTLSDNNFPKAFMVLRWFVYMKRDQSSYMKN